ncbi:OLC1v1016659C1 [Oldenlandia corymbosa var. corymbosa]|uniref:OLC1v1016659C1 n=1 Tax=Oldenlandia corymbosa var. corymbosa TaxID=529605 RepID=A0AAV1E7M2_OLDCO|nr:OLC1v1016659C1 [Oldenlandia corymbosa var. corymbosa]
MRKVAMCFSLFQFPRCRIQTLANSWQEAFPKLRGRGIYTSTFQVLGSNNHGLEGGHYRRSCKKTITTKTEGNNKSSQSNKTSIKSQISAKSTGANLNIYNNRIIEAERTQVLDLRQKISENKELAKLVTFIVFDIETTGVRRKIDRIIEIAFQDLAGGRNSTFQALVNPECNIGNSEIHGISTAMVNRADVPRMEDLIPLLLQYIKSRQKPDGFVVLIAHNARTFDVPFLCEEFSRYSYKIPQDWLFLDTLPMAREMMKSQGLKEQKVNLQALRSYFEIPVLGSAHRALADVQTLALVLQKMTFNLKLPLPDLIEKYSFSDLDLVKTKKERNSR